MTISHINFFGAQNPRKQKNKSKINIWPYIIYLYIITAYVFILKECTYFDAAPALGTHSQKGRNCRKLAAILMPIRSTATPGYICILFATVLYKTVGITVYLCTMLSPICKSIIIMIKSRMYI